MDQRRLIIFSIVGTGITSVTTQLITIREFLTQFHGNEITISMVLFCWLWLAGMGSLGAKWIKRPVLSGYCLLTLVIAVWPLLQLVGIRALRDPLFTHGVSPGFYPIFFYILILIAIVFYSMLISNVFKARIKEIGIFRSVGSTSKDIKRLFIYEAIFLFLLTGILSVILILSFDYLFNLLFFNTVPSQSNIYELSNIYFLINNHKITKLSFLNLFIQSIIVISIILYQSNKTINKIINIDPMTIIRGGDYY